jgi:hypothetical protein
MPLNQHGGGLGLEWSASKGRPENPLGDDASTYGEEDEFGDAAEI